MRFLTYWFILRPLILRDYRLRDMNLRPDRWYWADEVACGWGYFTA